MLQFPPKIVKSNVIMRIITFVVLALFQTWDKGTTQNIVLKARPHMMASPDNQSFS